MGRQPCCSKEGLNRGAWTALEDKILTDYIQLHGAGNWRSLPQRAGLKRCGKSCRLRWINYLRPDIKRGNITHDEEELIIRLHKLLGNRWSLIAGRLPGRTDNEIKNYWNTTICKKLQVGNGQTSSGKQVNQHRKNSNLVTEAASTKNSFAIRTKPRRLKTSFPLMVPVRSSAAIEGDHSRIHDNAVETPQTSELISKECEPSTFVKDFEMDEKFFLEFLNIEFEGSCEQHSPCINNNDSGGDHSNGYNCYDQQLGHSSSPDSNDHSVGIFFSDNMPPEYPGSFIDSESDWLQDYMANPH
ncbi:hypothetical protein SLA2020_232590 [Shorea laevis]